MNDEPTPATWAEANRAALDAYAEQIARHGTAAEEMEAYLASSGGNTPDELLTPFDGRLCSETTMGPKTTELVEVIEQIIELLDVDSETHWRHWMASVRSRLLNSDYSGVTHLLAAYGGMGSFSDLVIQQRIEEGVFVWSADAIEANDRLNSLREQAYELAQFIKRHHEIESQ